MSRKEVNFLFVFGVKGGTDVANSDWCLTSLLPSIVQIKSYEMKRHKRKLSSGKKHVVLLSFVVIGEFSTGVTFISNSKVQ